MAKTIASVSSEVSALDTRIALAEQRIDSLERIISDTNDSLTKIADRLSSISEDLAVIKDKENNKSFQGFMMDLGTYIIKIAVLGGIAYYILKGGI